MCVCVCVCVCVCMLFVCVCGITCAGSMMLMRLCRYTSESMLIASMIAPPRPRRLPPLPTLALVLFRDHQFLCTILQLAVQTGLRLPVQHQNTMSECCVVLLLLLLVL
jgi:hypothetical protein